MPKSANQKLKLMYLLKYLQEKTDEQHAVTMQQILEYLAQQDISAERKSIYADIKALQEFGVDIHCSKARENGGYYLASREFELPELKLLVDAVQASRFVTAKKSRLLIEKLEKLASPYEAKQLQRHVYVSGRIKNSNESIYYNVDDIHRAMQENKKISFKYYEWGVDKEMHFRRNGSVYQVSPYFLLWQDENYYLVAYDEKADLFKHYRVDKMTQLSVSDQPREGQNMAKTYNPAIYAQQKFGMFAGKTQTVTLQFAQAGSGVIFDRFGRQISIRKRGEDIYSTRVEVAVSPQFFGWLTGVAPGVMLTGPQEVVEQYRQHLAQIQNFYQEQAKENIRE